MKPTAVRDVYMHPQALTLLETRCRVVECPPGPRAVECCRSEHALVVIPGPTCRLTGEAFDAVPSLAMISRPGIGMDNIDIAAATERGVLVANTPDAPSVSTAEHTLSFLLALAKGHKTFGRVLHEGKALTSEPPATELRGKVLGLVGLGRIGRKMAHICRVGLEMKVVAFDPYVSKDEAAGAGVTLHDDLADLLGAADFVSIHCPPGESTRGLIDAEALSAMKPTAFLINCARGVIVDEAALADALKEGVIAGAGLDVYDPEPPSPDNPLFAMENVVATPHSAGYTDGCQLAMGMDVAQAVLDMLSGKRPLNLVNPAVWDSPNRRRLL